VAEPPRFRSLILIDAAEPRRPPRGIADFGDDNIRRNQRRIVLNDGERLGGKRLVNQKPLQSNAGVDNEGHRRSRSSRMSCSEVG